VSRDVLQLDFLSVADLAGRPESWWNSVLGVVGFDRPPSIDAAGVPVTASMTPLLGAAQAHCEVWRVTGGHAFPEPAGSSLGCVRYRCVDEFLFGAVTMPEEMIADHASAAELKAATLQAYRDIFAVLERTQHRHLLRVWNYLPEINRVADGDERYRHFNAARQAAFRDAGRSTVGSVPAASALGSPPGSPLSIHFLAARQAPAMIENPRQTSAYFYPPQFGSYSPTFSRASVLSGAHGTNLFVSGTASIVGYETVHRGDVAAQTRETLANIGAVVLEANRIAGWAAYAPGALDYKVYVRHASDLAAIRGELSAALPASTRVVYLLADVCRAELLMEIEATGEPAPSSPAAA
jgi:enamine deaminase RidA (YjgF/YER057c/UK114 family)